MKGKRDCNSSLPECGKTWCQVCFMLGTSKHGEPGPLTKGRFGSGPGSEGWHGLDK